MITKQQQEKVQELRMQYEENVLEYVDYGSGNSCYFSLYENTEEESTVLVVERAMVERIADDGANLLTDKRYLAILPDGTVVDLLSSFKNDTSKVFEYISKLKKLG